MLTLAGRQETLIKLLKLFGVSEFIGLRSLMRKRNIHVPELPAYDSFAKLYNEMQQAKADYHKKKMMNDGGDISTDTIAGMASSIASFHHTVGEMHVSVVQIITAINTLCTDDADQQMLEMLRIIQRMVCNSVIWLGE